MTNETGWKNKKGNAWIAYFQVERESDGHVYYISGLPSWTLERVWLSEKCWFITGEKARITDENGNSEVFTKEKLSGIAGAMPGRK